MFWLVPKRISPIDALASKYAQNLPARDCTFLFMLIEKESFNLMIWFKVCLTKNSAKRLMSKDRIYDSNMTQSYFRLNISLKILLCLIKQKQKV